MENRIDKIDQNIYQGYIWLSNSRKPIVLENEQLPSGEGLWTDNSGLNLEVRDGVHVHEAQLYSEDGISYSVKFVDGRYYAYCYREKDLDAKYKETKTDKLFYFGSKNMNDRKLVFKQYWKEEADENCAGFGVLKPAELIFIGFKKF